MHYLPGCMLVLADARPGDQAAAMLGLGTRYLKGGGVTSGGDIRHQY